MPRKGCRVTNAFRLLVRLGRTPETGNPRLPIDSHKRLSAVGPFRTGNPIPGQRKPGKESHKRLSAVGPFRTDTIAGTMATLMATVTNAFRLLVRLGLQLPARRKRREAGVTNAFRLLVRLGPT